MRYIILPLAFESRALFRCLTVCNSPRGEKQRVEELFLLAISMTGADYDQTEFLD